MRTIFIRGMQRDASGKRGEEKEKVLGFSGGVFAGWIGGDGGGKRQVCKRFIHHGLIGGWRGRSSRHDYDIEHSLDLLRAGGSSGFEGRHRKSGGTD